MRWTRLSVVLVALSCVAAAASADPAATSRLAWVTNGTVRAAAVHDQTLYIGGSFTRVAPAANFLGPWFGVSTTTGTALPRLPLADGAVLAIEPDGTGGYFVGGRFTRIGGVARSALARVLADGRVDAAFAPALAPAFPPGFDQPPVLDVRTIARLGDAVLVGGSFRATDGAVTRDGFAAFHPVTGILRGDFGSQAGTPAGSLLVQKILVDGASVFAMGQSRAFPVPGPSIVAMGLRGVPFWARSINGTLFDAVVAGGRLVVAGTFLLTEGAAEVRNLASLSPVTGAVDTA